MYYSSAGVTADLRLIKPAALLTKRPPGFEGIELYKRDKWLLRNNNRKYDNDGKEKKIPRASLSLPVWREILPAAPTLRHEASLGGR